MSLSGRLNEMTRKLDGLVREGAIKAAVAGARAATKEIEKGIKDAIPGQYREARKAIGRKVKRKGKTEVIGKVGAGVGKKRKKNPDRNGKPGVGLSENNIHWAILGVNDRQTEAGHNRGRHDGFLAGIVQQGASRAEVRAAVAAREAVKRVIEGELR